MITVEKARDWANKILKREREIQEDEVSAEMMQHMERRQALQEEIRENDEQRRRRLRQYDELHAEKLKLRARGEELKGRPEKAYERTETQKRLDVIEPQLGSGRPNEDVPRRKDKFGPDAKLVKEW